MANYGQALKVAGFTGIFFDNENYGRYGNYGDATCGSPHTVAACQSKMTARGAQIMQALISAFPNIVGQFFHDAYISDETFYSLPQSSHFNDIAFANKLVGPFEVGFVQATQGTQALVVQGGEYDFGSHTAAAFDNIYQYQKYGIVNDALAPNDSASRSAGANGYIPAALRTAWSNLVSGGAAIYGLDGRNPANNLPTDIATTITNALNRVDQYAWIYMETPDPNANPPHPSMIESPGSTPAAAPQAFVDAVRSGRAAAIVPSAISVSTSNITDSAATISWSMRGSGDPTAHTISISGLTSNKTYNYNVKETDSTGVSTVTGDLKFTTLHTYLSDRTPLSAINGWGPVEKDMSNGEQFAGDGRTISLRGKTFQKGLGVHAFSDVKYDLAGRCTSFSAVVGVDDEVSYGSVVFQVWGDGVKLYDTGIVTRSGAAKSLTVNIIGNKELELVVADDGDGLSYDHADWANAQLTCQ
ncbi:MAG: NPCBM/NEW2 domain-containing protein [Bryobacteraceae bacterium]